LAVINQTSAPEARENDSVDVIKAQIEAYNSHDVKGTLEFFSESAVTYSPYHPEGVRTRADGGQLMKDEITAFPDIQWRIERIFGQGDWVFAKLLGTGTNTGPLKGRKGRAAKPTKLPISIRQSALFRVQNGKIVEAHSYFDPYQAVVQLGIQRRNLFRTLFLIAIGLALMIVPALLLMYFYDQYFPTSDALNLFFPFLVGTGWVVLGFIIVGKTLLSLPGSRQRTSQ
jgi:ketosteroid isomerase-like protein